MSENREASLEENKAVVRRLYEEVINGGNLDLIDELTAPDYTVHVEDETGELLIDPQGRENLEEAIVEYRNAFPDFYITIEYQIAEGDEVATYYTFRGTHEAQFRGRGPTRERETRRGVKVDTVRGGRIVESPHHGRRWKCG